MRPAHFPTLPDTVTMTFTTLVSAAQLHQAQSRDLPLVLLDTRFDLNDPAAGEQAYLAGHLPGAHYAHLDRDLAGPKTGRNGRHPLPEPAAWRRTVQAWGITPATQVVVYDNHGGMFAARAWWLLRQSGHQVAVLDGGLAAWEAAGGTLSRDVPPLAGTAVQTGAPAPWPGIVEADALLARLDEQFILDARAPERYRGDVEPLDPVAGHIPGARNRFFKNNLTAEGTFKPAETLRAEFLAQLAATPPGEVVHQCGSGATACHNLLAMEVAGLAGSRLYPGSWSEWCSDPARPVAKG